MTFTLTGVPERIGSTARDDLARSLGFDLAEAHLIELTIGMESITATVFARNAEGRFIVDGDEVATHTISIPVEDS